MTRFQHMSADEYQRRLKSGEFDGDSPGFPSASDGNTGTIPSFEKYRRRKATADGHTFDSELERDRYLVLKDAERRGFITGLMLQPRFEVQPKFTILSGKTIRPILVVMDFLYLVRPEGADQIKRVASDGRRRDSASESRPSPSRETLHTVVEDTKGLDTPLSRLKRKLWRYRYPAITFRLIKSATEPVGRNT